MGMKVFASGVNFTAVTKSDTTEVNCKAIFVGTTGDIILAPSVGATPVAFKNLGNGTILPIELKKGTINAATTAADLVALSW
jgi:hypothetical protein